MSETENKNIEEEDNLKDYCNHNCDECQFFLVVESFCTLFDDEDYLNDL